VADELGRLRERNARTLARRAATGDDLTVTRVVDHALVFPRKKDAAEAAPLLEAEGFAVVHVGRHWKDPFRCVVELTARHALTEDALDTVVVRMLRIAAPLSGVYDGFNAKVIRPAATPADPTPDGPATT
jgi:hypothetical protein